MNNPKHLTVSVEQLCFDPDNPRLPQDVGKNQSDIFRYIYEEIGVADLTDSMSSSGFVPADPIIVAQQNVDQSSCQYIVIEGNRRLAAMKLLSGHSIGDGEPEPVIKTTPGKFNAIPVESEWDEDALRAYLGYKHVTAAREWEPEAKARFVLKVANGDLSEANLHKYASQFGTKIGPLKKWLNALLILEQAEAEEVFNPKNVGTKRYFGTFYTLVASSAAQEFLGFAMEGDVKQQPIPKAKLGELKEFLQWSIGTKEKPNIINSRSQKKLDTVLRSPKALEFFRQRLDLDAALYYTEFNAGEIAGQLRSASYTIEATFRKLHEVREHKGVREAYNELKIAFTQAQSTMDKGAK